MIDASVVVAAGDQHNILTQNPPSGSEKEPLVYAQLANESHDLVLEKLPAELRLHVLSQLDLESLKSLVHASPVYHAQYLMDRKQLLFKTHMATLGGAALDAQLAFHSGKKEFQDALSRENVERFLRSYETYRSSSPWHLPHAMSGDGAAFDSFCFNDTFTLAEVSSMVKFHNSVIKPLVQYFAEWALENMIQLPGAQSYSQPLSETEKVRIFRALYRYQICCNLFGSQLGELEATYFDAEYILMQLETLFEPWENEEVVCITLFFESKSNTLATVIRRDLDGNHDKCDEELKPQLDNPFGPSDESEQDHIRGLLSQGLSVLKETLWDIKDRSQLLSSLRQNAIDMMEGHFLGTSGWDAFGLDTITGRMARDECERDIKERERVSLPFRGDHTMDPDGVYPPFAWTVVWLGTYSNQLGTSIGDNIHCWGYVFWDSTRMEGMGAREVLKRQCGFWRWGLEDPRDRLALDELVSEDEDS